jgi:predicted P-loop ATPase
LEALQRDRDQLFAEAVLLYRKGVRWWPDTAFEIEHIIPEQEARFEADPWEDEIRGFLGGKSRVLVNEVARDGLFVMTERIGTATQRRISGVLTRLGWARLHGKGTDSTGKRWWVPRSYSSPQRI